MWKRDWKPEDITFRGVGMLMILIGATFLAVGFVFWLLNFFAGYHLVSPSLKILGGAILASLGYVILELELLRKK